jgi:hypothetical protein
VKKTLAGKNANLLGSKNEEYEFEAVFYANEVKNVHLNLCLTKSIQKNSQNDKL